MKLFVTPRLAIAMMLAVGASYATPSRAAPKVTIEIGNFQFSPPEITVEAGTIVEWVNHDQTVHNIILTTARVSSPGMDTGDHYSFQFVASGDYPYLCGLHPHMTGMVHVKPRA
jgi:plastocyanin